MHSLHRYHDMDDVLDFLILDSVFQSSIAKNWEVGESFQSLIDGVYWKGTILKKSPFRLAVFTYNCILCIRYN